MHITLLGTSHGVPELNRRCSCAMIQVGDRYYFVDMGMNPLPDLINRGISMDSVKGVFITHTHGDHVNGIPAFAHSLHWPFKTADPVFLIPEQNIVDLLKQWLSAIKHGPARELRWIVYKEGVIYNDGYLKVTAIPTKHLDVSYAFLLEAEEKRVLFTGDLEREHPTDFPQIAYDVPLDMIFCEGAHFPVTEYKPIFEKCDVKQVCIQHWAPWNRVNFSGLINHFESLPITVAGDGEEFDL